MWDVILLSWEGIKNEKFSKVRFDEFITICSGWNDDGQLYVKFWEMLNYHYYIKDAPKFAIITSEVNPLIISAKSISSWQELAAKMLLKGGVKFNHVQFLDKVFKGAKDLLIDVFNADRPTGLILKTAMNIITDPVDAGISSVTNVGYDFKSKFQRCETAPYTEHSLPQKLYGHSMGTLKATTMTKQLSKNLNGTNVILYAPVILTVPELGNISGLDVVASKDDFAVEILQNLMGMNAISLKEEWQQAAPQANYHAFDEHPIFSLIEYYIDADDADTVGFLHQWYIESKMTALDNMTKFKLNQELDPFIKQMKQQTDLLDVHSQLKIRMLCDAFASLYYRKYKKEGYDV